MRKNEAVSSKLLFLDPQKVQKRKKSKFCQSGAVSSKIFDEDPMTNVLRLTGEQKKNSILDRWAGDMARPKIKVGVCVGGGGVALTSLPDQ